MKFSDARRRLEAIRPSASGIIARWPNPGHRSDCCNKTPSLSVSEELNENAIFSSHAGNRLTNGFGPNQKWLTGNQRNSKIPDYKECPHLVQCQRWHSDYMSFSVDGYCQRCQQRTEFVIRKRPTTIRKAVEEGVHQ